MSRKRPRDHRQKKTKRQTNAHRGQNIAKPEAGPAESGNLTQHLSLTFADVVVFIAVLVVTGLLVKYSGEDRLATIHCCAALAFLTALFVCLRVVAWKAPERAHVKRKVAVTLLVVAIICVTGDRFWASRLRSASPVLEQPTFVNDVSEAEFSLGGGGMHFRYPLSTLEKSVQTPIVIAGYGIPFQAYVQGRKLYVNATVVGINGRPVFQIVSNHFSINAPGWDCNSSKRALEVVDSNQSVVFQLVYRTDANIEINGIFPTPGGLIWATPWGTAIGHVAPFRPLPRLFKYPSWRYPGVFSD